MSQHGQVSLEFLLLISALLVFLSVSASALSALQKSATAAIDARNAAVFVLAISTKADMLIQLGEGSEQSVSSGILGEWSISNPGGRCVLEISSLQRRSRSFSLPEIILCGKASQKFTKKIEVRLVKTSGKILLLY